jgi:hypothetical protein
VILQLPDGGCAVTVVLFTPFAPDVLWKARYVPRARFLQKIRIRYNSPLNRPAAIANNAEPGATNAVHVIVQDVGFLK